MKSRKAIHSIYKQDGCICLLANYGFMLEYFASGINKMADFTLYNVFAKYLEFHNLYENICFYSAEEIERKKQERESYIGSRLNHYCQSHGDIAGYKQIELFHNWLITNNNPMVAGVHVVAREPASGQNRSKPISNAYKDIHDFLIEGSTNADHAALILFLTSGGKAHSVLLGYDGDFFIRDSNMTDIIGNIASFDFTFERNSQITEYLLFSYNE